MVHMKNSHPLLRVVLGIVGLVVVGAIAWWVVKVVLGLLFYLIVGALVVGGAVYLYGKTKGSITGRGR